MSSPDVKTFFLQGAPDYGVILLVHKKVGSRTEFRVQYARARARQCNAKTFSQTMKSPLGGGSLDTSTRARACAREEQGMKATPVRLRIRVAQGAWAH